MTIAFFQERLCPMTLPILFFLPRTFITRTFEYLDIEELLHGLTDFDLVGAYVDFEVVLIRRFPRDRALFRNQRLFYDLMHFH